MIVTSSSSLSPALSLAAAPGTAMPDVDFMSLLVPTADQPAAEAPRQDVAGDGKELPPDDTAADAWLATIGVASATLQPAAPLTPAPASAIVAAPPAAMLPAAVVSMAGMAPSMAAPAPALPPTIAGPDGAPPPQSNEPQGARFMRGDAMPPFAAQQGTLLTSANLREGVVISDVSPLPQSVAATRATPATTQMIAAIAERPTPLVQGLIAPVRTTGAACTTAPRAPDRERIGEMRADGTIQLPLVAAAIEPHRTMLDLRQEHWPERMIAHIETLRDAVDANDTRIRLVPDALGTVDVQLRRDGDTVHVAFAAERAETRALLDQAQPKLTELGESRGLRFAQAGPDQGGGQPQHRAVPEPRLPHAPVRSAAEPDAADDTDTIRIA